MLSENIRSIGGWLLWNMKQVHMCLVHFAPAFAMVAWRAGCHQIRPNLPPAQMAWNDMVDRQIGLAFAAILTGIIIAAEYFTAR
jgi:hypothetical protein